MYYYFWGLIRIDLPISMSTFKLSPETINDLSVEYTDIENITDIADTDGDGKELVLSVAMQDIFGGMLDITDIVFGPETASIKDAEISGLKDKTYTGKQRSSLTSYLHKKEESAN